MINDINISQVGKCKNFEEIKNPGWKINTKWGEVKTGKRMSEKISSYWFKSANEKYIVKFKVKENGDLEFNGAFELKPIQK
jgi:hypothetical protein